MKNLLGNEIKELSLKEFLALFPRELPIEQSLVPAGILGVACFECLTYENCNNKRLGRKAYRFGPGGDDQYIVNYKSISDICKAKEESWDTFYPVAVYIKDIGIQRVSYELDTLVEDFIDSIYNLDPRYSYISLFKTVTSKLENEIESLKDKLNREEDKNEQV